MKFECKVEIDASREKVIAAFLDEEILKHCHPDLQSKEQLEGEPFQVGAKAKMEYKNGKQEFTIIETVTENRLPESFSANYDTTGICWNSMENTFTELGFDRTLYVAKIDYKFHAFMIKLMSWIMPRMFKKQTQKVLNRFKEKVETE